MSDHNHSSNGRRDFLKLGTIAAAAVVTPGAATAAPGTGDRAVPHNPATAAAMATRNLGQTGYQVGIFSLGGQAALERGNNEERAIAIIERALDLGVNYIDTSSIYGGAERWSERYIGQVMKRRRSQAFLNSKTKERTRDGSMRMIEKSLELLNTDHLDCWQLHDIGLMEDVDAVFAKGGAMEALIQAKEQKMVRHLGLTGHFRPDALMAVMRRYRFDTILLALNAADSYHYSFAKELLPLALEQKLGIIGMKIPGRSRLLSTWNPPPVEAQKRSWEGSVPATTPGTLTMREALYFTLSHPVSTVIVGCDTVAQLEENIQLARAFTPLSPAESAALAERAAPVAKPAMFFKFTSRP